MKEDSRKSSGEALRPILALAFAASVVFALALAPMTSAANTTGSPLAKNPAPITIAAGGTATITARGFCLDFGKPFPTQEVTVNGLADSNVRAALNYAVEKQYTDGNPQQVELAIWFLRDGTWHAPPGPIAQEVVTNATTANVPAPSEGMALTDAITQNRATATGKFVPQTADHFYGDGQVVISNTGTSELRVYLPVGTIFSVPNSAGAFQNLAAYQLQAATQPTGTATVDPAATATTVVTATATTAVQTTTPVAAAATATTEATPTTMAVETSTPAPTTAPSTLPQTGNPGNSTNSGGMLWLLAVLTLISLAITGSGALVLSKRRA